MNRILDTHVHSWDLERATYPWLIGNTSLLNQTWRIEQLEQERLLAGVTEGILVQAAGNNDDTKLLLDIAANTEWIKGVVIWLPLQDSKETERLMEEVYLNNDYVKGVRHQVHDENDDRWLLQPEVITSLKIVAAYDLPYDLVGIRPAHLETAIELSKKVQDLRIAIDHLNQPPIVTKEKFGEWGESMKRAASINQFHAKISGLGTTSGKGNAWTAEDIAPYVEFVLQEFGVDRCFCGGDWPVSLLAGSYSQAWNNYREVLRSLTNEEELDRILYTNAQQFYTV